MHDHTPTTHDKGCASSDCTSGKRNRFFRGKHMKADEFLTEQVYFIERRRLVNRAVLGWGVVYGFALTGPRKPPAPCGGDPERQGSETQGSSDRYYTRADAPPPGPINVGPGFALDRHGREIMLVESTTLGPQNTFLVEAGSCQVKPIDHIAPGRYLLSIHYAERRFGDAHLPEGCACDKPEKNFVCETAVFSLQAICGDDCPCAERDCERECKCDVTDSCCATARGPHACLCQWVTHATVADATEPLCEWNGYWISPAPDGVGLACVTVAKSHDKCAPVVFVIDDDCGPRRLVKNNDLLYDLLRGCDLTRIDWISWDAWHRAKEAIAWDDFAKIFHAGGPPDGTTEFVVKFSGPVLVDTIRFDSVVVTAITVEQATGWRVARRVPIARIDTTPDPSHWKGGPLPAGTTNQIRLVVKSRWIRDEIETDEESWLSERGFAVEIEVRGDLILDCHRQAIDGNAIGTRATPSGNGTPGGTFLSSFQVDPKPVDASADVE